MPRRLPREAVAALANYTVEIGKQQVSASPGGIARSRGSSGGCVCAPVVARRQGSGAAAAAGPRPPPRNTHLLLLRRRRRRRRRRQPSDTRCAPDARWACCARCARPGPQAEFADDPAAPLFFTWFWVLGGRIAELAPGATAYRHRKVGAGAGAVGLGPGLGPGPGRAGPAGDVGHRDTRPRTAGPHDGSRASRHRLLPRPLAAEEPPRPVASAPCQAWFVMEGGLRSEKAVEGPVDSAAYIGLVQGWLG